MPTTMRAAASAALEAANASGTPKRPNAVGLSDNLPKNPHVRKSYRPRSSMTKIVTFSLLCTIPLMIFILPIHDHSLNIHSKREQKEVKNKKTSATDYLDEVIERRCNQFSYPHNANLDHQTRSTSPTKGSNNDESVAFIHVQKAGGNSFQDFFAEEAKKNGTKAVVKTRFCFNWCQAPTANKRKRFEKKCFINPRIQFWDLTEVLPADPLNTTSVNECMKKIVRRADVLMGHENFAEVQDEWGWNGNWMTVMRHPVTRLESAFKWGIRVKSVREDINNQAKYQQGFDNFLLKPNRGYAKRVADEAFIMHAPADLLQMFGLQRSKNRNAVTGDMQLQSRLEDKSTELQSTALERLGIHIAERFSVVGVLDRVDETLEVAQCRFPWMKGQNLPHSNAQPMKFPHKVIVNETLIKEVAVTETYLYDLANRLLSVDVVCCRNKNK